MKELRTSERCGISRKGGAANDRDFDGGKKKVISGGGQS